MKNKELFATFMRDQAEIHIREVSERLLDIYWQKCEPYTDEECKVAFCVVEDTCQFFPKPVDLLTALDEARKEIIKNTCPECKGPLKDMRNGMCMECHDRKMTDPA